MTEKEFMLVYRYLHSLLPDMPEWLCIELRTINQEIMGHVEKFRRGDSAEPDWTRYAREINYLLEQEGFEPIFTMVTPLTTSEA